MTGTLNAHSCLLGDTAEVRINGEHACAEAMIAHYTRFLNAWHDANGETDIRVTRSSYDEYGESPLLVFDYTEARRTIQLKLTPYHDEGGWAVLTGIFDDESLYGDGGPRWVLDTLLHEFDTDTQPILLNDKDQGFPTREDYRT